MRSIAPILVVAVVLSTACAMPGTPSESASGAATAPTALSQAGLLELQLSGYLIGNAAAMQLEPVQFRQVDASLDVRLAWTGATLQLGVAPIRDNGMWPLRSVPCSPEVTGTPSALDADGPAACYDGVIRAPLAVDGLGVDALIELSLLLDAAPGEPLGQVPVVVRHWSAANPSSFDDDLRTMVGQFGRAALQLAEAPADCDCPTAVTNGDPGDAPNNYCHLDAWTPGCPMTFAGGYCDLDGNGIFEDATSNWYGIDADWARGFSEAAAAGCPAPPPSPIELCCGEVSAAAIDNNNFCFAAQGCGAHLCPASNDAPDGLNWDLGWYRYQCWCAPDQGGVDDVLCAQIRQHTPNAS